MTSKRDLGPMIAIAGAAIAIIAVIAGFIIIGGPGDARDRRIDEMTTDRLMDVFNVAQCAFNGTGAAPSTFEAAVSTQGRIAKGEPLQPCNFGIPPERLNVFPGRNPPNPGDISYESTGRKNITLCANFRRPLEENSCNGMCAYDAHKFPFVKVRPAGIHCYDMQLTESVVVDR